MSRSRKKPWIKGGNYGSEYWRPIRRAWRHTLSTIPRNIDITYFGIGDCDLSHQANTLEFSNNRAIINDYDFCDYRYYWNKKEHKRK